MCWVRKTIVFILISLGFSDPSLAQIKVFVASSLIEVMGEIAQNFEAETEISITLVAAGSSTLAQQIVAGAPADVFISANKNWIDFVQEKTEFEPSEALFSNRLVVITHASTDLELLNFSDLPGVLGQHRLALGNPAHVPAGIYARQALENEGIWLELSDRIAPTSNVRAALRLVSGGGTPLGIVYASDAQDENARVIYSIDARLHDEIVYWGATRHNASEDVLRFFTYLRGENMISVAQKHGFSLLKGS